MTIAQSHRFATIDFTTFHQTELLRRLASGNNRLAAPAAAALEPLAFRVGADAYTYAPAAGTIEIAPGDATARTVVRLSPAAFSILVNEIQTAPGLLYTNGLAVERGDYGQLDTWEPALRAMWNGRPVYDPSAPLLDRQGRALDFHRSFSLEESDAEAGHFLDTVGFLHVSGVFSEAEIGSFREAIDRLISSSAPGDRRSWWATTRNGEQVCCRLLYLGERDPRFGILDDDPRLRRLAYLSGEQLVTLPDRMDGHSAVIKNGDVVEGLSDLPWHVDCGLGGHPIICPSINIGVQLGASSELNGRLGFVPGSHRGTSPRAVTAPMPVVFVDAEPGDCTVHFGHAMHAAPAPTGSGRLRIALYSTWYRPSLAEHIGPFQAYNDALFRTDGSVPSMTQLL